MSTATTALVELTLQVRDLPTLGTFSTDVFDLRVLERDVVEVWDFFEHGEGAAHGTDALAKEPD